MDSESIELNIVQIHPDVKELDLTRTRSKKIEGLDHLKKINSLCFRWNLLSKIENLSNLVTLTELDLYDNQQPLAQLDQCGQEHQL
uniref:Uncharacterized protein n=1 Tax=Ditylenchus dipsaci TaxID=166011 RepID=A0A915EFB6_9BILA